jgi:hypothetical protein
VRVAGPVKAAVPGEDGGGGATEAPPRDAGPSPPRRGLGHNGRRGRGEGAGFLGGGGASSGEG